LPRRPPGPPPPDPAPNLIDRLKRRSSIVNMLDPAATALSMVAQPAATLSSLSKMGQALYAGNLGGAKVQVEGLVARGLNPPAPYSYFYKGGQVLGAVVDGTIGGLEIAEGIRNRDPYMGMMGVADMLGGTASAVVAAGYPGVSLAMTMVAAGAKSTLVITRPDGFSRIQKMKACFDAASAVSIAMMRAGIGVVPALGLQAALGATELLYMNSSTFQHQADAAINWVGSRWQS
jgi:hypothetical protein